MNSTASSFLIRRGFGITRKRNKSNIGKSHLIKKEEAVEFIKNKKEIKVSGNDISMRPWEYAL